MTAVDLDALDAARAAATPGPAQDGNPETDEDAALIAAALSALPDLIADARELRALREAVEGLAEDLERQAEAGRWFVAKEHTADWSYAQRLRAVLAAALTSEGERE